MTINKNLEGSKLTVAVEGRLDTTTAPQLEEEFKNSLEGVEDLVLDFSKLDYISSAGLRVLLATRKNLPKGGDMIIRNANQNVMDIFTMTGFDNILTIE